MSEESAIQRAAKLLAMRQYSRRGLCRKLIQKGISEEAAEAAAARMEDLGFLDDAAYGRHLIAVSIRKGHGPLRMEQALVQAELSQSLRQQLLDEITPEQEEAWAFDALCRLCRNPADLADPAARRRISAKLYRSGYHWSAIQTCLRRFLEQAGLDL